MSDVDEFGLPNDRRAYSDEYYAAWDAALSERDKAGADYVAMALWRRKPVDEQGDTSDHAFRIRAEKMEAAALRWLEYESLADRMTRVEFEIRRREERAAAGLTEETVIGHVLIDSAGLITHA